MAAVRVVRVVLMVMCVPLLLSWSPLAIVAVPILLVLFAVSAREAGPVGRHIYAAFAALLAADIGAMIAMALSAPELPFALAFTAATYVGYIRLNQGAPA